MKVHRLIKMLEFLDKEAEVIMSSDGEGNSYSPVADVSTDYIYVPDSTWSGEIHIKCLTGETLGHGYSEEDLYVGDDATPCVVLYPTN